MNGLYHCSDRSMQCCSWQRLLCCDQDLQVLLFVSILFVSMEIMLTVAKSEIAQRFVKVKIIPNQIS